MKSIVSFVTAFCTVCVITGGLSLIMPSGKMEKTVKYIFSLVFLVCLLSAGIGLKNIKIEYNLPDYSMTQENTSIAAAKWNIEFALKRQQLQFSKIDVCTDKTEDGGIIINKVIVYSSESAESIRELLGGEGVGYAVEVIGE